MALITPPVGLNLYVYRYYASEDMDEGAFLESAGVNSLAELREVDDLTELDGIGSAYAEEISEALDEFDETGSVSS